MVAALGATVAALAAKARRGALQLRPRLNRAGRRGVAVPRASAALPTCTAHEPPPPPFSLSANTPPPRRQPGQHTPKGAWARSESREPISSSLFRATSRPVERLSRVSGRCRNVRPAHDRPRRSSTPAAPPAPRGGTPCGRQPWTRPRPRGSYPKIPAARGRGSPRGRRVEIPWGRPRRGQPWSPPPDAPGGPVATFRRGRASPHPRRPPRAPALQRPRTRFLARRTCLFSDAPITIEPVALGDQILKTGLHGLPRRVRTGNIAPGAHDRGFLGSEVFDLCVRQRYRSFRFHRRWPSSSFNPCSSSSSRRYALSRPSYAHRLSRRLGTTGMSSLSNHSKLKVWSHFGR